MIRTRLQGDTPFFPNMLNNRNVEVCLKEDVDKVIVEKDAEHALQIAKMNDYIHHLEEELRWRKFPDEKPEEWDTVVVRLSGGFYDLAVYLSNDQGWDIGDGLYHKSEEVTHWVPLPSAPKEAK